MFTNRPTGRLKRCYRFCVRSVNAGPLDNEQEETRKAQNSKYDPARAGCVTPPVPVAGSKPSSSPCRLSQAASVSAGSAPTMSRIICQAARLSAPSGAGPMASETEHCGQKQIRCAEDFWRGLTPTVCAKRYTATDFCPASSSRLQRRQYKLSKSPVRAVQAHLRSVHQIGAHEGIRRSVLRLGTGAGSPSEKGQNVAVIDGGRRANLSKPASLPSSKYKVTSKLGGGRAQKS